MSPRYKILILGWFGTETVGDKAILGGIIRHYQSIHPNLQIKVASLYPYLTRQTLKELDFQAQVVATHSWLFIRSCALADEVVLGGGPLMDMDTLAVPLWGFLIATFFKKKRVIFGCGMGPLKQAKYVDAVKKLLMLSTTIKLRDSDSARWAKELSKREDIEVIADPASNYVREVGSRRPSVSPGSSHELACFIRDWPQAYAKDMHQYQQIKEEFERNLAAAIRNTCQAYQLKPVFYAMHTFTVGGDDREFNRRFITAYLDGLQASYQPEPSSVDSIIDAMLNARLCICMRFHSVVFAHNLDRPFVAIDYTNGGKIKALLQDNGLLERLVSLQDIGAGQLHLIEERLSKQLEQSAPIQGEVDLGCDQKMRF